MERALRMFQNEVFVKNVSLLVQVTVCRVFADK